MRIAARLLAALALVSAFALSHPSTAAAQGGCPECVNRFVCTTVPANGYDSCTVNSGGCSGNGICVLLWTCKGEVAAVVALRPDGAPRRLDPLPYTQAYALTAPQGN